MATTAKTAPHEETAAEKKVPVHADSPTVSPPRMLSLDVFRGLTIAGMILVNNAGNWNAVYGPLKHADWHGWTMTDLVFPFFLFIVGVSLTLSFAKRIARGDTRAALFGQVIRRSLIIFLLGLLLAGFPYFDFSKIRIPGVLQRIAICYLCAAVIYLTTRLRAQIAWALGLLAIYWLLMVAVPVPGYGAGVLTPEGSFEAYIDSMLLSGHTYQARPWDPEGTVSTLPAIATALFGVLTGHWLRAAQSAGMRTLGLLGGGAVGVAVGLLMDIWLPINKNIWTSSYCVFTAGMALLFLGACYWIVDVQGWKWWTKPFVVFGSNAITVYVLSGLVGKSMIVFKTLDATGKEVLIKNYLYETWFAPLASPINASLIWAICYVLIWLGIMWIFYWRKIFLKV
jgi:predicted acyltransferase